MRCQIEKNKEILCGEIEKLGEQKMSEANAAKLCCYVELRITAFI